MKITNKTKFRKIAKLLLLFPEITEQTKSQITRILPTDTFDYFGMTVKEFLQLQENKMPKKIERMLKNRRLTFFKYVEILNTFEAGTKQFSAFIEKTNIEQSQDEAMASVGLLDLTAEESILEFLRGYFNLQKYEQAHEYTLYEFMIAKKNAYNRQLFEKNFANLQKNKP